MKLLFFGQIVDITGSSELVLDTATDTNTLRELLAERFPQLANIRYVIAVDKQLSTANTPLNDQSVVALLPPFSGG